MDLKTKREEKETKDYSRFFRTDALRQEFFEYRRQFYGQRDGNKVTNTKIAVMVLMLWRF